MIDPAQLARLARNVRNSTRRLEKLQAQHEQARLAAQRLEVEVDRGERRLRQAERALTEYAADGAPR